MKYLLLVYHNEEAFSQIPEGKRKDILLESIPLPPTRRQGAVYPCLSVTARDDCHRRSGARRQADRDRRSIHGDEGTACRLFSHRGTGSR